MRRLPPLRDLHEFVPHEWTMRRSWPTPLRSRTPAAPASPPARPSSPAHEPAGAEPPDPTDAPRAAAAPVDRSTALVQTAAVMFAWSLVLAAGIVALVLLSPTWSTGAALAVTGLLALLASVGSLAIAHVPLRLVHPVEASPHLDH